MRFSRLISFAATTTVAAMIAIVPSASAAERYLLKLDNVTGEARTTASTGVIELKSFELGAENPMTFSTSTGAGSAKTVLRTLTIEKNVDSTSPVLFQRLVQGSAIPGMELVVIRSGPSTSPIYLRYQFQGVYVTAQTHTGSSGDSVSEKLELTYAAVKQSFIPQSNSGVAIPTSTVAGVWNQVSKSTSMLLPGIPDTTKTFRIFD